MKLARALENPHLDEKLRAVYEVGWLFGQGASTAQIAAKQKVKHYTVHYRLRQFVRRGFTKLYSRGGKTSAGQRILGYRIELSPAERAWVTKVLDDPNSQRWQRARARCVLFYADAQSQGRTNEEGNRAGLSRPSLGFVRRRFPIHRLAILDKCRLEKPTSVAREVPRLPVIRQPRKDCSILWTFKENEHVRLKTLWSESLPVRYLKSGWEGDPKIHLIQDPDVWEAQSAVRTRYHLFFDSNEQLLRFEDDEILSVDREGR